MENENKIAANDMCDFISTKENFIRYAKDHSTLQSPINDAIIQYIADFKFYQYDKGYVSPMNDPYLIGAINTQFDGMYSREFAYMLKSKFPDGKVCYVYPDDVYVFMYNNIIYDINGIAEVKGNHFIDMKDINEKDRNKLFAISDSKDKNELIDYIVHNTSFYYYDFGNETPRINKFKKPLIYCRDVRLVRKEDNI